MSSKLIHNLLNVKSVSAELFGLVTLSFSPTNLFFNKEHIPSLFLLRSAGDHVKNIL